MNAWTWRLLKEKILRKNWRISGSADVTTDTFHLTYGLPVPHSPDDIKISNSSNKAKAQRKYKCRKISQCAVFLDAETRGATQKNYRSRRLNYRRNAA